MMMYVLQDEGFQVVTSQEGVSRDYLLRHDPALILLDDRLAAGFGRDLCMKIKKDPATRRIPVVLVSAVKELAQISQASGADAYLNKPFDLVELIALARRFT